MLMNLGGVRQYTEWETSLRHVEGVAATLEYLQECGPCSGSFDSSWTACSPPCCMIRRRFSRSSSAPRRMSAVETPNGVEIHARNGWGYPVPAQPCGPTRV